MFEVTLIKDGDKGIGLTIVGGETTGSLDLGIFVKSVTNDGPAAKVKGHTIQAGDRLIAINGVSLEGVQHHEAVQLIRDSNPSVTLLISQMAPPTTFRRKNDYNSSSQRSSYAPDIYDDNPVCHSDDEGLEEGEDYGCCPVNYPLHHASSHVHSSLGISLQNQTSETSKCMHDSELEEDIHRSADNLVHKSSGQENDVHSDSRQKPDVDIIKRSENMDVQISCRIDSERSFIEREVMREQHDLSMEETFEDDFAAEELNGLLLERNDQNRLDESQDQDLQILGGKF